MLCVEANKISREKRSYDTIEANIQEVKKNYMKRVKHSRMSQLQPK